MGRTKLTTNEIGSVQRNDFDVTTTGEAVITKVIAGTGISLSSTGVDAGTGDVTINVASSTYQPLDSDLTTIAGLVATTDNFIVSVASAWASRTPAQVKTTLALNNVENTALSTWAGSTNITTLGTIATGTWNATTIGVTKGGTGITSISAKSIWVANSANTITELTPGAGQSIRINAGNTAWELYTPSGTTITSSITFVIDGGGTAITTGIKGDLEIPFACTITGVTMLADTSGSIVVDIWKDTYANYPPVVGDSITASAKPTISSNTKSQDNTLTGWTTSISAGDTLRFNVDSASTITRVTISLKITRT